MVSNMVGTNEIQANTYFSSGFTEKLNEGAMDKERQETCLKHVF